MLHRHVEFNDVNQHTHTQFMSMNFVEKKKFMKFWKWKIIHFDKQNSSLKNWNFFFLLLINEFFSIVGCRCCCCCCYCCMNVPFESFVFIWRVPETWQPLGSEKNHLVDWIPWIFDPERKKMIIKHMIMWNEKLIYIWNLIVQHHFFFFSLISQFSTLNDDDSLVRLDYFSTCYLHKHTFTQILEIFKHFFCLFLFTDV